MATEMGEFPNMGPHRIMSSRHPHSEVRLCSPMLDGFRSCTTSLDASGSVSVLWRPAHVNVADCCSEQIVVCGPPRAASSATVSADNEIRFACVAFGSENIPVHGQRMYISSWEAERAISDFSQTSLQEFDPLVQLVRRESAVEPVETLHDLMHMDTPCDGRARSEGGVRTRMTCVVEFRSYQSI